MRHVSDKRMREHYFINASKSVEVDLKGGTKLHVLQQQPTLGDDKIEKSASEVHLGVTGTMQGG